jgi:hypothetical protein
MTRAAVLGLVLLVLTGASEAAAKTPVTVKFVLKAYDGQFDTAEVETIQRQVAEQIAARRDCDPSAALGLGAKRGAW